MNDSFCAGKRHAWIKARGSSARLCFSKPPTPSSHSARWSTLQDRTGSCLVYGGVLAAGGDGVYLGSSMRIRRWSRPAANPVVPCSVQRAPFYTRHRASMVYPIAAERALCF